MGKGDKPPGWVTRHRRALLRDTLLDAGNRLAPYVDGGKLQAIARQLEHDPEDRGIRAAQVPFHLSRWLQRL